MLAVCLLAIVVLGYGFYIWFFITSSEHSQVRLLNILNVYLSVGCISGSVTAFIKMLTSGLGYPDNSMERILGKPNKIFKNQRTLTSERIFLNNFLWLHLVGFNMVAITATFLLISLATFLNQFMPKIYLDLSLLWRHSVALPTIITFCIIIEALILYHCHNSLENECFKITIRRFVLFPAPSISFILHTLVIIDDVWGLRNIVKFVIPVNETPVNDFQNSIQGLLLHHGVGKINQYAKIYRDSNLGIYLNFYWVLYTLSLQLVWFSCRHVNNFAENLQRILPLPGLAQCDGSYPGHLDFKKQQNEGENE